MRTASSNMAAHLAGEVTSLAVCWKLTLVGGTVMGFTDHTSDLTVSSQLYKAATGFSPTSVETKDKFSVDNLDVAGILDAAAITEADIMAGKYDFAEIKIFMVNVTDLSQGIITYRRGWLGEVTLKNGQFVAEVVWLTGANAGRRMEIKEFSNKQFTLVLPMPNNVTVGDTFNAIAGCDKTISTCIAKFNNAVNFRGEPYVPGMDKMLATAATANDLQRV